MSGVINWSPGVTLEAVEQQVIVRAFQHFQKNKTVTANALGISIRTLDSKLERYEQEQRTETENRGRDQEARDRHLARARGITTGQSAAVRTTAAEAPSNSANPQAGLRVEPAVVASAEHAVSLPERGEVQEMLPPKAAQGGNRGRR